MDAAAIDVSVALGFSWRDPAVCRRHNDYLIEAADAAHGRIVPFPTLPLGGGLGAVKAEMRRCVDAGARGFGELRPDDLDFDLAGPAGEHLGDLAREMNVALLFHVTEPVGHAYPGKQGLSLERFYRFVAACPNVRVIGAHWGGGLPFYAAMPEVRALFESGRLAVDTAATSLLYDSSIYTRVAALAGPEAILFGSDFPLLSQKRSRRRIEEAGLAGAVCDLVLGGNAARILGLQS